MISAYIDVCLERFLVKLLNHPCEKCFVSFTLMHFLCVCLCLEQFLANPLNWGSFMWICRKTSSIFESQLLMLTVIHVSFLIRWQLRFAQISDPIDPHSHVIWRELDVSALSKLKSVENLRMLYGILSEYSYNDVNDVNERETYMKMTKGRGPKKQFYLGLWPKQRTPPTHPPLQFRTPKSDRKFHEKII